MYLLIVLVDVGLGINARIKSALLMDGAECMNAACSLNLFATMLSNVLSRLWIYYVFGMFNLCSSAVIVV